MSNYKDVDGNMRNKSAIEKRNNRKKIEAIKRRKRKIERIWIIKFNKNWRK